MQTLGGGAFGGGWAGRPRGVATSARALHDATRRVDGDDDDPSSTTSSSSSTSNVPRGASVDRREVAKFAALADRWWDARGGPFAPLHALNPARVRFIRRALCASLGLHHGSGGSGSGGGGSAMSMSPAEPLAGLRILDVGCGGGLLAESLARLGARVTGIDLSSEGVGAAAAHAAADPLVASRVRYLRASAEELASDASEAGAYDAVVASEVIEHARDPGSLVSALAALAAPGQAGRVVVTTLNRTPAAWAVAVAGAEYISGAVPKGTHEWHKFITPQELAVMAADAGMEVEMLAGMSLDLLGSSGRSAPRFLLGDDVSVNYAALLRRRRPEQ